MTETPHELAADFPEFTDTIDRLKTEDTHFQKLWEEYHVVNYDIHQAETDVAPTSDDHLNEMRIHRVRLKDELYEMLKAAD